MEKKVNQEKTQISTGKALTSEELEAQQIELLPARMEMRRRRRRRHHRYYPHM